MGFVYPKGSAEEDPIVLAFDETHTDDALREREGEFLTPESVSDGRMVGLLTDPDRRRKRHARETGNGSLILAHWPGAIAETKALEMHHDVRSAAVWCTTRGASAGAVIQGTPGTSPGSVWHERISRFCGRLRLADGRIKKFKHGNGVYSGVVGLCAFSGMFKQRYGDANFTNWTINHPEAILSLEPVFRKADEMLRTLQPEVHARQREAVGAFGLFGTAFTSLTVNRNFRTGLHKDAGNLPGGRAVLMCTTRDGSPIRGMQLCFPRFSCAVDLQPTDAILCDNTEWHCNLPRDPADFVEMEDGKMVPKSERMSYVFYAKERVCRVPDEEKRRIVASIAERSPLLAERVLGFKMEPETRPSEMRAPKRKRGQE